MHKNHSNYSGLLVLANRCRIRENSCMRIFLAFVAIFGCSLATAQSRTPQDANPNLVNCIKGFATCEISTLRSDEIQQVSDASKRRNLDACLSGASICDPTRLAKAEMDSVQSAWYRRNRERCVNGSPLCDP